MGVVGERIEKSMSVREDGKDDRRWEKGWRRTVLKSPTEVEHSDRKQRLA